MELTGFAGWLILSLPLFLLLLAIFRAFVRRPQSAQGALGQENGGAMKISLFERPTPEGMLVKQRAGDDYPRVGDHVPRDDARHLDVQRHAQKAPQERIQYLQERVLASRKNGDVRIEADARMELGDIAEEMSDMTMACEHWQIARDLFHALDEKTLCAEAEEKMLRNGCPTDWLLNDF